MMIRRLFASARRHFLGAGAGAGSAWRKLHRLPPGLGALLEVGVMFLPSIPAYLWVWPNLGTSASDMVMSGVYLYTIAGALWIGLRRWNLGQLGVNLNGMGLSMACGAAIIAGRLMVIASINWMGPKPTLDLLTVLWQVVFYFGLVGIGEELLFRGLVYRALEDWLGSNWAIWGSSLGFVLWHIFGQGPLIGAAMLFYGLIFALMRRRGEGILGLIFIHGLMDLANALVLTTSNTAILEQGRPEIPYPGLLLLGLGLLVAVPVYLWRRKQPVLNAP